MIDLISKYWKDPVWSKVISTAIIAIITFLISLPFWSEVDNYWDSSLNFVTIKAHELYEKRLSLSILNLFLLIAIIPLLGLVYYYYTKLRGNSSEQIRNKTIKEYNEDVFWGIIIKWKWVQINGEMKIKSKDYQLICPTCLHNLRLKNDFGYYYLQCMNCGFQSDNYHYEDPYDRNKIIYIGSESYFDKALKSKVDAVLRSRGLK